MDIMTKMNDMYHELSSMTESLRFKSHKMALNGWPSNTQYQNDEQIMTFTYHQEHEV